MKNLNKALVGTVAAGAMALSSAAPAVARDNDDRIDAGEVIAGALIIGGIAAVLASSSNKRDGRYYDRNGRYDDRNGRYEDQRGYRGDYDYRRNGSRQAVEQCVRAAERDATRYTRGRADVTQIRDVKRKRDGYDVKGYISVGSRGYGYRSGGYDTGKFTCKVRYGRITDINYRGIRGLR